MANDRFDPLKLANETLKRIKNQQTFFTTPIEKKATENLEITLEKTDVDQDEILTAFKDQRAFVQKNKLPHSCKQFLNNTNQLIASIHHGYNNSSFANVPTEIFLQIFSFLKPHDKLNLLKSSKIFYLKKDKDNILENTEIYEKVCDKLHFSSLFTNIFSNFTKKLLNHHSIQITKNKELYFFLRHLAQLSLTEYQKNWEKVLIQIRSNTVIVENVFKEIILEKFMTSIDHFLPNSFAILDKLEFYLEFSQAINTDAITSGAPDWPHDFGIDILKKPMDTLSNGKNNILIQLDKKYEKSNKR